MLSTNENTTTTKESKERVQAKHSIKPRAQLKHALIRVNFMSLGKVRALKRLYGLTSKLALIEIYLTMSCATNAVISKDAILDIAEENEVKDSEGFFNYCVQEGLIQPELGGFSNSVVIEDQEQYAKKLKIKPEQSEINRTFSGKNPRKSPDKVGFPDTDYDYDTDHVVSSKEGGAGETIPTESPEASEALRRWGEYTQKTLKKPWDQIQAEALIMRYHGRNLDFIRDVNGSISSGWRTVRDCADLAATRPRAGPNAGKTKEEAEKERKKIIEAMERGFE
jgi:hypothetical protein